MTNPDRTQEAAAYRTALVGQGHTPLQAARKMRQTRRSAEKVADDLIISLGDRLAEIGDDELARMVDEALTAAGL